MPPQTSSSSQLLDTIFKKVRHFLEKRSWLILLKFAFTRQVCLLISSHMSFLFYLHKKVYLLNSHISFEGYSSDCSSVNRNFGRPVQHFNKIILRTAYDNVSETALKKYFQNSLEIKKKEIIGKIIRKQTTDNRFYHQKRIEEAM